MRLRCTLCHRDTDGPVDGERCPSCGGAMIKLADARASASIVADYDRVALAPAPNDIGVGKGAMAPVDDAPERGDSDDHIDTRTLDFADSDTAGESAAAQALGRLAEPVVVHPKLDPIEPSAEDIEEQLDVTIDDEPKRAPASVVTTRRDDDREFWDDERPFDSAREQAASIEGLEFEDEGLDTNESSAAKALSKLAHIDPKKAVPKVSFRDLPPLPDEKRKGKKAKLDRTPAGLAKAGGAVDNVPRPRVAPAPSDDTELRRIEATLDYSVDDEKEDEPAPAVLSTRKDDDATFWQDEAFDAQRDAAPKMAGIKLDDAQLHFESGAAELRGRAHGDASLIHDEEDPLTDKLIEQVPDDLRHAHIQSEQVALPWTEAFKRPWAGENKLHLIAIALVFGVMCDFGVIFGGVFLMAFARGDILSFIWPGTILFVASLALALGTISAHMMTTARWVRGGHQGVPDTPDLSDFWGDFIKPAFQMFVCKFVYLGVGLAMLISGSGTEGPMGLVLICAGLIWSLIGAVSFGMAMVALVENDAVLSANPITVWRAMRRTWRSYTKTSAQLLAGGVALLVLELALWQSIAWLPPIANAFIVPVWLGAYAYTNLVVASWVGDFARVEQRALGWSVKR